MLVLLVELAHDQHEHRADSSLDETEEKSLRVDSLPVMTCRRADQSDSPSKDNARCDFLDGVTLSHENGRVGTDNEAEIEDGRREGEPVADSEVKIIPKTEQRGLRDHSLVVVLQAIANDEDGEEAAIDLFPDLPLFFFVPFLRAVVACQDRHRLVIVATVDGDGGLWVHVARRLLQVEGIFLDRGCHTDVQCSRGACNDARWRQQEPR